MSVKTEYVFLFLGLVLAIYDCVICQGKRTYSTSRDHYEKLVKYQTLEAHQLCNSVLMKEGTNNIYRIGHLSAESIIAKKFWHNTSCGRHYTRPIKKTALTSCMKYHRAFLLSADLIHRKKCCKQRKYNKIQYSSR